MQADQPDVAGTPYTISNCDPGQYCASVPETEFHIFQSRLICTILPKQMCMMSLRHEYLHYPPLHQWHDQGYYKRLQRCTDRATVQIQVAQPRPIVLPCSSDNFNPGHNNSDATAVLTASQRHTAPVICLVLDHNDLNVAAMTILAKGQYPKCQGLSLTGNNIKTLGVDLLTTSTAIASTPSWLHGSPAHAKLAKAPILQNGVTKEAVTFLLCSDQWSTTGTFCAIARIPAAYKLTPCKLNVGSHLQLGAQGVPVTTAALRS